jgi:hypothetical protein
MVSWRPFRSWFVQELKVTNNNLLSNSTDRGMRYDPLLALSLQPESPPQFRRVGFQALKAAGLHCSFDERIFLPYKLA